MTQPTPYARTFDFTMFAVVNPATPRLPGPELDAEFNNARTSLNEVIANLAAIQRDDLRLANQSVSVDQLADTVLLLMAQTGFRMRGIWAPGVLYSPGDVFLSATKFYLVVSTHTSAATLIQDILAIRVAGPIFIPEASLTIPPTSLPPAVGALNIGWAYSVQTASAPAALILPSVSVLGIGQYLEIQDLDCHAGTNNITVTADGTDTVKDHAVSASTFVLNVDNMIARFTVVAGGWRVITYGG